MIIVDHDPDLDAWDYDWDTGRSDGAADGDRGRCAGCGLLAVVVDGEWVNPGPGTPLAVCVDLASPHGPFLPEDRP